jgi:hypothetical protein
MYSKPAVGPEVAKPDESLGRVRDSGETGAGRDSNSLVANVLRAGSRAWFKRPTKLWSETYGALPLSYSASHLRLTLVGLEPTTSGVTSMYSKPAVGLFFGGRATR